MKCSRCDNDLNVIEICNDCLREFQKYHDQLFDNFNTLIAWKSRVATSLGLDASASIDIIDVVLKARLEK